MKKKPVIIVLTLLVALGALYLWVKSQKPSILDIPSFSSFTFISAQCKYESGEEICRILSQQESKYLSFKIEGRYKELLNPLFSVSLDNECIRAVRFADERQVDYSCLEYFIESKTL